MTLVAFALAAVIVGLLLLWPNSDADLHEAARREQLRRRVARQRAAEEARRG